MRFAIVGTKTMIGSPNGDEPGVKLRKKGERQAEVSARMRTIIAAAIATVPALCGNARAGEACHHVLNMDPVFIGDWEWLSRVDHAIAGLAVEDCPGDSAFYIACSPDKNGFVVSFDHHKGPPVPRRELTIALDTGITLRLAGTSTMTTQEGHSFETAGFESAPLSQEQINALKQAKNEIAVIAGLASGEPIVFKVKGIAAAFGALATACSYKG